MPDIFPSPRRSSHVKAIYLRRTIQHTPVSPCTSAPQFSLAAPFLQFNPTASCNGIQPFSMWGNTSAQEGGSKEHRNQEKWLSETRSSTYAPGLSTFSYPSRIIAQPPPSSLCCPRPPAHHPSSLPSVYSIYLFFTYIISTSLLYFLSHALLLYNIIIQ